MSGIAGFVNLDRAPADCAILAGMMEAIAFRGPDAQDTWAGEAACLGHTLLKTTDEAENEHQPFSLDGKVWIVADARIDARRELAQELRTRGHDTAIDTGVTDVELILRAYCAWQENCVDHLLGDFAFGIWDAPRRLLFCARDHFGVKPFYYAHLGQSVIFSNTLESVRRHPAVSDRLNDLAIADFLLFDSNQDPATTAFADIQRMPAAHCAIWSENGLQLRRYWTLPIDEPIFYRRQQDYILRFQELLRTAVNDRLRTNRVGIFMSGGLDSTTLAAMAHDLMKDRSGNDGVRAFTIVHDDDEERHYAGLVAASLKIPIEFGDNIAGIDPEWFRKSLGTPEPQPWPTNLAWERTYYRHMASHSRVALYGEGPDNALIYEWRPYLAYLLQQRRFRRLIHDSLSHAILHRRIPIGAVARLVVSGRAKDSPVQPPAFPDWLNPDFENRLQLRARWEEQYAAKSSPHPIRPSAYQSFTLPTWQELTTGYDAERTRATLEVRHPFLDLRLLRYLLAIPVLPWCRSKYLLRKAMQGMLPEAVLWRPKTGIVENPWTKRMLDYGMPPLLPARSLEQYVDPARVPVVPGTGSFWAEFRVRSLCFWLRNVNPSW